MKRFKTILKHNIYIFSFGLILIVAGEYLPIRDFKLWNGINIRANFIQILGVVLTFLPVLIWYHQNG